MLESPSVIDLVTRDKKTGAYRLILVVEDGEWELPESHELLQEKINAYLSYLLDGEMSKRYPDLDIKTAKIIIQPTLPPAPETLSFIHQIAEAVRADGVDIEYIPLSQ